MTLVAGVDSSTQSCKIVIRDAETGAFVRSGRASHPDGTEVDPAAWWNALLAAIRDAGGLDDVAAISIGGQQHGMVVLDARGRVIRDALLWNDTRSAQAAIDLLAEVGADGPDGYAARVGALPVASFTATKLRWLRDAEPANAERVAAVALPHDWLTWRLLGYGPADESPLGPELDALATDRSDASGTSYWSPAAEAYDLDLFERALGRPGVEAVGVAEAELEEELTEVVGEGGTNSDAGDPAPGAPVILPRVVPTGHIVGTTVAHGGDGAYADPGHPDTTGITGSIPAGILVGAGMGDNAGAALGLDARPGDVVISIGTSGTAFAVTDHPVADLTGTVAGFADAAGGYLPIVVTLNAARILSSISELLSVDYDEFARLALAAAPGAGGAVLVPYFEGERTPNLPHATATLAGLTIASASRENLARAAIEGMLCGLADGVGAIRSLGVETERLLLVGGAAQNAAVQTVAAQVFDVPVSVPTPGEYVADGAARQAAWTLTGSRPTWPVTFVAELAVDTVPQISEQYRRAQALGSTPRA
ncbi:xylulose kinase [Subtercola boreus]|uniref:Xylulose kinase n=1 Tax=Subtercola boreus TaxID=120213 RepID=A0A3E0VEE4_9MICO|nr:FGGY family carbohydrate kinase [Subtercola boreus]RFA08296.1 xylulose kinase [Subtercola boreus]TQL54805.1 xylulokinase [Subtercola boreus]